MVRIYLALQQSFKLQYLKEKSTGNDSFIIKIVFFNNQVPTKAPRDGFSGFVLAEISVRSPWKLFNSIILKKLYRIEVPKRIFYCI